MNAKIIHTFKKPYIIGIHKYEYECLDYSNL